MRNIAIAIMLVLMASAAVAQGTYSYHFDYHSNGGYKIIFESQPGSVRGYDIDDVALYPSTFGPSDIALTIYKQNGKFGWDGDTGFYVREGRSPLAAGQTEVFEDIYLWAGTAVTPLNLQLSIYNFNLDPNLTYKLRLVSVPQGVNYTGPREWGSNHGTISLPFFATDDFTKGYMFRAEITAVPEPSSLLALAGGLAGVGGVVLRRRW